MVTGKCQKTGAFQEIRVKCADIEQNDHLTGFRIIVIPH